MTYEDSSDHDFDLVWAYHCDGTSDPPRYNNKVYSDITHSALGFCHIETTTEEVNEWDEPSDTPPKKPGFARNEKSHLQGSTSLPKV